MHCKDSREDENERSKNKLERNLAKIVKSRMRWARHNIIMFRMKEEILAKT